MQEGFREIVEKKCSDSQGFVNQIQGKIPRSETLVRN